MIKKKLIMCLALIVVLLLSSCGGSVTSSDSPDSGVSGNTSDNNFHPREGVILPGESNESANLLAGDLTTMPAPGDENSENDADHTAAVTPESVELRGITSDPANYTCTLSVRCDAILANLGSLNPEKAELVPEDGVILSLRTVEFFEGESVFNILQREMKRAKIHMEFVNAPGYNSAYIKGINNLREFDCGELSGWSYRVNGLYPGNGCSQYKLRPGDAVEIIYTCDLGRDGGW